MAETKYDLLLVPTLDNSRIKQQPWYRERLKTKYCKPDKKKQWKPNLSTSSWTFIQDGLDDFRDGAPPEISNSTILHGAKGLFPNVVGSDSRSSCTQKEALPKKLSNKEQFYLKSLPQQNRRRERVEMLESSLLEHPLALYSHLEESVAPDVFEDIVELLDPALNLSDVGTDTHSETPSEAGLGTLDENMMSEYGGTSKASTPFGYNDLIEGAANPYKWIANQQETVKEERTVRTSKKRPDSPSQNKKIEEVTHEFCGWVRDLGGETNNIEESTIYSLFASGYETKPALSVPLHVVELTNVPPELRSGTSNPPAVADISKTADNPKAQAYTPSWVKVKYGAWYLDPKSWKARAPGEPLLDPKTLNDNRMSESKQKGKELDKVLTGLHGAKAFKDFVDRKGVRKPEFLDFVSQQIDASNHQRSSSQSTPNEDQDRTPRSRTNTVGSRRRHDLSAGE